MVRRTSPQRRIDDVAFPIRVKFVVPSQGLGEQYPLLHVWLRDNVGTGNFAVHSAQAIHTQAIAIYFTRLEDATRFCEALPDIEIADGTRLQSYYSPYRRPIRKDVPMDSTMMLDAARVLADRLQRSLDNPATEHVILRRDEAVIAKGLIDGLRELLEREAGV